MGFMKRLHVTLFVTVFLFCWQHPSTNASFLTHSLEDSELENGSESTQASLSYKLPTRNVQFYEIRSLKAKKESKAQNSSKTSKTEASTKGKSGKKAPKTSKTEASTKGKSGKKAPKAAKAGPHLTKGYKKQKATKVPDTKTKTPKDAKSLKKQKSSKKAPKTPWTYEIEEDGIKKKATKAGPHLTKGYKKEKKSSKVTTKTKTPKEQKSSNTAETKVAKSGKSPKTGKGSEKASKTPKSYKKQSTQTPTTVQVAPTVSPTAAPTTASPTLSPTAAPTTASPTLSPTAAPTTASPTLSPTAAPAIVSATLSVSQTLNTESPTQSPTLKVATKIPSPSPSDLVPITQDSTFSNSIEQEKNSVPGMKFVCTIAESGNEPITTDSTSAEELNEVGNVKIGFDYTIEVNTSAIEDGTGVNDILQSFEIAAVSHVSEESGCNTNRKLIEGTRHRFLAVTSMEISDSRTITGNTCVSGEPGPSCEVRVSGSMNVGTDGTDSEADVCGVVESMKGFFKNFQPGEVNGVDKAEFEVPESNCTVDSDSGIFDSRTSNKAIDPNLNDGQSKKGNHSTVWFLVLASVSVLVIIAFINNRRDAPDSAVGSLCEEVDSVSTLRTLKFRDSSQAGTFSSTSLFTGTVDFGTGYIDLTTGDNENSDLESLDLMG